MPDWERLLAAAARLQGVLPGAVLVGGTAAAAHAKHRFSRDADHVIADLKDRFDEVLEMLNSVAGWKLARVKRPVLILGSLDGIETGVRQLIREAPLEVQTFELTGGDKVVLPTASEILRIKGALILKRNATRDYLDFAAIADHLGPEEVYRSMGSFDQLYPQPSGQSALQQLLAQLGNATPFDLDQVELPTYKGLKPRWHRWEAVQSDLREIAAELFRMLPPSPALDPS